MQEKVKSALKVKIDPKPETCVEKLADKLISLLPTFQCFSSEAPSCPLHCSVVGNHLHIRQYKGQ